MIEKKPDTPIEWDDAPEWNDEVFDRAEISVGGKVIRPATGTLTRADWPSPGTDSKQQATLLLDCDVVAKFEADGPGWQSRINAALRVTMKS